MILETSTNDLEREYRLDSDKWTVGDITLRDKNLALISKTNQEIDQLLKTLDATGETFRLLDYLEYVHFECVSGTGLFPDEDLLFDTMRVLTRLQGIPVENLQQDLAVLQYRWTSLEKELLKQAPQSELVPQSKPQVRTTSANRERGKPETYQTFGNPKNTLIAAVALFVIGWFFAPTIFWSLAIICLVVAALEALANNKSKREFEKNT
jgi:hypothetical protein